MCIIVYVEFYSNAFSVFIAHDATPSFRGLSTIRENILFKGMWRGLFWIFLCNLATFLTLYLQLPISSVSLPPEKNVKAQVAKDLKLRSEKWGWTSFLLLSSLVSFKYYLIISFSKSSVFESQRTNKHVMSSGMRRKLDFPDINTLSQKTLQMSSPCFPLEVVPRKSGK